MPSMRRPFALSVSLSSLALNFSSSASAHQQLFYNLINEFSTFYSLKSKIDRRIKYFFIYYIMP